MRALTRQHRLQALSVSEITDRFEDVAVAIGRVQAFQGRKAKAGPLLNAMVLWFLGLPEPAQLALATEYLARLEVLLAETDEERRIARANVPGPVKDNAWLPGSVRD